MSGISIFAPRRLGRLVASDAMNISRDPMLLFATVLSLVPAIAFHFGRAPMDAWALASFGLVDLSRYVAPVVLLIPAFLVGWVTGFLALEDRDDGPLLALDVTPVGKGAFLAYRVSVTAAVTIGITLFAWPLVVPDQPVWVIATLALLIAMNAILAALVLPAVARNKVEGLALTKVTNILSLVPLIAIIGAPWRYLAAFLPSFWIGEMLDLSGEGTLPVGLVAGLALVVHAAAVAGLFWLIGRRAG